MGEQETFGKRLREARKRTDYTQEELGRAAGFDEAVANARMNQYEKSKHWPSYSVACQIAKALKVDPAFFYASSDDTAQLLQQWSTLTKKRRAEVLEVLLR
jgi:transcriptional regulator with XRE-family HTH domain